MSLRLVSSGGAVTDPAVLNLTGSGVIHPGEIVDFTRAADYILAPSGASSTTTMVFGVAQSYIQGETDSYLQVIPFAQGQIWEIDCANAVTTAQLGRRQVQSATRGYLHNTGTDLGAGDAHTAVFEALSITGSTSGSGKIIGRVRHQVAPVYRSAGVFI